LHSRAWACRFPRRAFSSGSCFGNETKAGKRKTLIAIFQRGAVDGLNMVVPFGESNYYELRPSIAIPKPSQAMLKRRSISTAISACIRR
jgi:uncharacterized protein (DUF1501 family)